MNSSFINKSVILLACWFLLFLDWHYSSFIICPFSNCFHLQKHSFQWETLAKGGQINLTWNENTFVSWDSVSFWTSFIPFASSYYRISGPHLRFPPHNFSIYFFPYLSDLLNCLINQNSFFIVLMKHCCKMSHFQRRAEDATGDRRYLVSV